MFSLLVLSKNCVSGFRDLRTAQQPNQPRIGQSMSQRPDRMGSQNEVVSASEAKTLNKRLAPWILVARFLFLFLRYKETDQIIEELQRNGTENRAHW